MRFTIRKFLRNALVIVTIYVVINIIHFCWFFVGPEGYWGFVYFIEILSACFFAGGVLFIIGMSLRETVIEITKRNNKRITKKDLLSLFGTPLAILFVSALTYTQGDAITLFLNKKFTDKYAYLNQSRKLIDEGNYIKAMADAEKAYQKYSKEKWLSPFLCISYIYQKSDGYQQKHLMSEYQACINYAFCLQQQINRPKQTEIALKRALTISECHLIQGLTDYKLQPLSELAEFYLSQGNYALAESYFQKFQQQLKNLSDQDLDQAITTNLVFAGYAEQNGDTEKSYLLNREALDLCEKSDNKNTYYPYLLLICAGNELKMANLKKAGELLVKAQPIANDKDEHALFRAFLKVKSYYCYQSALTSSGNEQLLSTSLWETLTYLFKAKPSTQQRFLDETQECITKLTAISQDDGNGVTLEHLEDEAFLADFFFAIGHPDKAEYLYNRIIQTLDQQQCLQPLYYKTLVKLALTQSGREKAFRDKNLATLQSYYQNRLVEKSPLLTESEREKFAESAEQDLNTINSIYATEQSPESNIKMYNNAISIKCLALYENQAIRAYLNRTPEIRKRFIDIQKQKNELSQRQSKLSSPVYNDMQEAIDQKEKKVTQQIMVSGQVPFNPIGIDWIGVKQSLQPNEAAIEFLALNDKPMRTNDKYYYALVLKSDSPYPILVSICKEEQLALVLDRKGSTKDQINAIYGQHKQELYQMLWQPLNQVLQGVKKIYVSPTGLLNRISLPALLEDQALEISIVGSTREIQNLKSTASLPGLTAIFGAVKYGASKDQQLKNSTRTGKDQQYATLPYTKKEVEGIQNIFNKSHKNSLVYTSNVATEAAFRKLPFQSISVLHLATHGISKNNSANSKIPISFRLVADQEDMLNQCQLILSEPDHPDKKDTENDGILTAREVADLDLSKIDLVVLSACETGLGKTTGSEGVYGFQRGFKLAGAKSLIVSLWRVPDQSTSELMQLFYFFYLQGKSKSAALKSAQVAVRRKYPSPYYWAGFILIDG